MKNKLHYLIFLFILLSCSTTQQKNNMDQFKKADNDKSVSIGISKLKTEEGRKMRLGIFDFNSPKKLEHSFDIPNALANAFVRFDFIDVIERKEIKKISEELKLGMTGMIDNSTALQVGKLVSANYMLLGNVQIFGEQIRIDARVIETETGKIVYTSFVRGNYNDLLSLEEELTEKIAESLKK